MKESNQYQPPSVVFNIWTAGGMPGRDEVYNEPRDWLRANVRRFYATDKEIISAAIKESPKEAESEGVIGVYFLIRNCRIVYVGMSRNIPYRLWQHCGRYDSFAWIETPSWCAEYIEAYYINRISPDLNAKMPGPGIFTSMADEYEASLAEALAPMM